MLTQYQIENFEGAGFIFMTEDMDILLLKDTGSGKWGMCKGHRDLDEDHYLDTATREAREELGLDSDDYYITSAPFVFRGSPKIYIFHYAILKKPMEDLILQESEVSEVKLVPIDELMDQDGNRENNIYVRLMIANALGTYREPKPRPVIIAPKPIKATTTGWVPSYMREKLFVPIISESPEENNIDTIISGLTINTCCSPIIMPTISPRTTGSPRTLPSPLCGASILRPSSRSSPSCHSGRAH
jgi:8-oxo-dGTP pyrophosphatase MutT (NUDIX family)